MKFHYIFVIHLKPTLVCPPEFGSKSGELEGLGLPWLKTHILIIPGIEGMNIPRTPSVRGVELRWRISGIGSRLGVHKPRGRVAPHDSHVHLMWFPFHPSGV